MQARKQRSSRQPWRREKVHRFSQKYYAWSTWQTNYNDVDSVGWPRGGDGTVGVGFGGSPASFTIESAEITEISGEGKPLRAVVLAETTIPPNPNPQAPSGSGDEVKLNAPPSSPAAPPAASDVPLLAEAKRLMSDKKYTEALVPLRHLMGMQGHDADAFSRHEVLMLVAECQLQLHQVAGSLSILDIAIHEASGRNDWPHRAEASALATLLRTAPKLIYAPPVGDDHKPLDLTDITERRTGFGRLYDEKYAFCDQQQRSAREGTSLQPLLDTAAAFGTCRTLEQVTANSTARSDALGDQLAKWSADLTAKTLANFSKRIDAIVFDSNVGMKGRIRPGRAGLSDDQREELEDIDAACLKVPGAIAALNEAFARPLMTNSPKNMTDAKNISTRVEAILASDARIVGNRK